MRRSLLLAAALVMVGTGFTAPAYAQGQRRQQQDDEKSREAAAKKRKQSEEWGDTQAPLAQLRNAGPCPYVKVLYDAARYVEFQGGREASAAVGYSGEIQGISATCEYKDAEPIRVRMEVLFELGKGPTAQGSSHSYRYWVAVTKRNDVIIDKQYFDLPVNFPNGQPRIYATETIDQITIPRATMTTSGANFEILIGFEVTPQMAEFNRAGKRFRVNVGGDAGGAAAQP
ncbi:MAG TPA: Tat pathway signal sequence domain protein [Phenylobacterium sp.]